MFAYLQFVKIIISRPGVLSATPRSVLVNSLYTGVGDERRCFHATGEEEFYAEQRGFVIKNHFAHCISAFHSLIFGSLSSEFSLKFINSLGFSLPL